MGLCVEQGCRSRAEKHEHGKYVRCRKHRLVNKSQQPYYQRGPIPLCSRCKAVRAWNYPVEFKCKRCQDGWSIKAVLKLKQVQHNVWLRKNA